ncbi:PiggyBac transposable element-derived protein 4 [Araneus ventricosus]|uniref:PiggyBac transposable element-derived protein 4 n=1 Tax=Araneus ventricosus TaxID=182803 RepID=A0A4Y2MXI8_ARAVE|nr:PiggyBac transposable element-derived protein 4 [Araneus ventricosus]
MTKRVRIFFDEKIMSFIVEEANRCAEDFFNKSDLTPSSRALNWKNTDIKELNLLFGLNFTSRNSVKICRSMVLEHGKRYGLLIKFFDIHEMLVQKFKSAYTPNQSVTIDEHLVAFKGLLGWKQYIPTKSARFRLKFFQLCESENGYIWNSIIYTGKGTIFMEEYEHYGLPTK